VLQVINAMWELFKLAASYFSHHWHFRVDTDEISEF